MRLLVGYCEEDVSIGLLKVVLLRYALLSSHSSIIYEKGHFSLLDLSDIAFPESLVVQFLRVRLLLSPFAGYENGRSILPGLDDISFRLGRLEQLVLAVLNCGSLTDDEGIKSNPPDASANPTLNLGRGALTLLWCAFGPFTAYESSQHSPPDSGNSFSSSCYAFAPFVLI